MNNYSVKFLFEFGSVLGSIFPYAVDTYEKITGESVSLAVIKCNDIGEVIVLKIFLVYIQYIIIRTEDYRYVPYPSYLAFGNKLEPAVGNGFSFKNKGFLFLLHHHYTTTTPQFYDIFVLNGITLLSLVATIFSISSIAFSLVTCTYKSIVIFNVA